MTNKPKTPKTIKECFKKVRGYIRGHLALSIVAGVCFLLCVLLTIPLIFIAKNGFYIEKEYEYTSVITKPSEKPQSILDEEAEIPKVEIADENSAEDTDIPRQNQEQSDTLGGITIYDSVNKVVSQRWQALSYGIDVSSHEGKIDWKKVAAAGVEFVMIRCGYRGYVTGKIVQDARFEENIKGAYENGIAIGIYFYSTAINEAEARQEAAWVCSILDKKAEQGIKILYPVAYDFEEFFNKQKSRAENLSRQQLTKNTIAFLNRIALGGYTPMLYASKSSTTDYWDFDAVKDYDFWLAHYVQSTNYTGEYAMWQYTSRGKVDGIKDYVDLNVSYYRYVYPSEPIECINDSVTVYNGHSENSGEGGIIVKNVIYERIRTLVTGWSEIRYNGVIGYVKTDQIRNVEFTPCDKEITLDSSTKTYSVAVPNDKYKVKVFEKGTVIKVTATYKDKWYECELDGGKVYFMI